MFDIDQRRNPEGNQNYSITKLWDTHREMIRLAVVGYDYVEISKIIRCTPQTVSNVLNTDLAKAELIRLQSGRDETVIEIEEQLREAFPLAVRVLTKTMSDTMIEGSDDPKLLSQGVRSASTILDHVHPKTVKTESHSLHLTMDDIDGIKKKFNAESAEVVEAEIVEVIEAKPSEAE